MLEGNKLWKSSFEEEVIVMKRVKKIVKNAFDNWEWDMERMKKIAEMIIEEDKELLKELSKK